MNAQACGPSSTTGVAWARVGAAPATVATRAGGRHLEGGAQQRRHPAMQPRGNADAALAPAEQSSRRAYRARAAHTVHMHMHMSSVHACMCMCTGMCTGMCTCRRAVAAAALRVRAAWPCAARCTRSPRRPPRTRGAAAARRAARARRHAAPPRAARPAPPQPARRRSQRAARPSSRASRTCAAAARGAPAQRQELELGCGLGLGVGSGWLVWQACGGW